MPDGQENGGEPTTDYLARIGRQLFGSEVRLRVAVWIYQREDSEFYADLYWRETGHYTSSTATVIQRLADLGMLRRADRFSDGRTVAWERTPSPLWRIIGAAVDGHNRVPDWRWQEAGERLLALERDLRGVPA